MTTPGDQIGLIGLGNVGLAFAHRLIGAGHRVHGFRRSGSAEFAALGGAPAVSTAAVAQQCATIIIAVPDHLTSAKVRSELYANAPGQLLIIDSTTMTPDASIAAHAECAKAGHLYVEAPVSGVAPVIREGQATIIAAGDKELFERAEPLLAILAARRVYAGDAGAASAIKAAAMLMMTINMTGVAEGFAYAEAYGVSPALTFETLKGTPASSATFMHRGPMMVAGQYPRTLGRLEDARGLLKTIAASSKTPTAMLDQVITCLGDAVEAGLGDQDSAAVFEHLRKARD